jgi:MinD-like ATPase involved in chromosome partitioning or flagellar assembly
VGLKRLVHGLAELAEVLPHGRAPVVVVTKVRRSAVGAQPERQVRDAVRRHARVATVVLVPDDRGACDAALLHGRPLTAQAPSSPARRAVAELARQLAGSPAPRRRRHAGRRAEQ